MKPMEEILPNTCSSSLTAATAVTTTTCSNLISSNTTTTTNNSNSKPPSTSLERKVRPQKDQAVNCPRCNSTNTKFCYYNNYSLTQPRFFCKTCRRYWTEGGSLRNIPVGGGSRKNKRPSSSSYSSSSSKKISSHDLVAAAAVHESNYPHHQNPKIHPHQMHQHHHHHQHYQGQDLNLGFPHQTHHNQHQHQQQEFRSLSEFMQLPTIDQTSNTPKNQITNSAGGGAGGSAATTATTTTTANDGHHHLSALELLNGLTSSRGLTPFMPMPVPDPNGVYSSGFSLQDFKPSLNFSLVDGLGNGYGSLQGDQVHHQTTASETNNNNNGRLLFPFEDLKQVSSTTSADHNNSTENNNHDQNGEQEDSTPGYWSGMLGNGGSW
ncbi:hypothetical protein BVRB_5g103620 [Beta vulgaris subsp. vulgaris]|nr:hypothetical protein BVRB_5g103620 [Beta vulgaris subsp. vulgaris]